MADLLACKQLRFAYRGTKTPALDRVDFNVKRGEFVGVAGATGAGKSTLLHCATGVVPKFYKGPFEGEVLIDGRSISDKRVTDLAGAVGTLFQDFESQLFSTSALLELAFGMENTGIDRATMKERIRRVSRQVGLEDLLDREPMSLSGGQKQRLALASVLCLEPELLLCDEPTTDLDPVGKQEVFDILDRLTEGGRAVVLVEHETERMVHADRIAIMNQGRIIAQGPPGSVLADPDLCLENGIYAPQLFALFHRLGLPHRPLLIAEAAKLLAREGFGPKPGFVFHDAPAPGGPALIDVADLHFGYTADRPALAGVSLQILPGEFVAILGKNGSGKTTLVKHLNGLLKPHQGRVLFEGKSVAGIGTACLGRQVGFVFQNPDHMLFAANVFDEVAFGLKNYGVPADRIEQKVGSALETVGLAGKEAIDPFIMTKGERQKLAVACVLACEPQVLILDEPTTGLDAKEQKAMMELLQRLNRAGHTIIIITHTLEVAAAFARRVVLLEGGRILADGPVREVFHQPDLLARTQIIAPPSIRLGQALGVPALTVDELASALARGRP